jgi:hypothetical protein
MDATERRMFIVRLILTIVLLPICGYVVLARAKYATGDKSCAYATIAIATVLAFWARS